MGQLLAAQDRVWRAWRQPYFVGDATAVWNLRHPSRQRLRQSFSVWCSMLAAPKGCLRLECC